MKTIQEIKDALQCSFNSTPHVYTVLEELDQFSLAKELALWLKNYEINKGNTELSQSSTLAVAKEFLGELTKPLDIEYAKNRGGMFFNSKTVREVLEIIHNENQ